MSGRMSTIESIQDDANTRALTHNLLLVQKSANDGLKKLEEAAQEDFSLEEVSNSPDTPKPTVVSKAEKFEVQRQETTEVSGCA